MRLTAATALDELGSLANHLTSVERMVLHEVVAHADVEHRLLVSNRAYNGEQVSRNSLAQLEHEILGSSRLQWEYSCDDLHAVHLACLSDEVVLCTLYGSSLELLNIFLHSVVLLVLFLFGGIGFFLMGTPSSSIAKSTVAREALPSNAVTETGYYTDADGDWIHNQGELTAGLRKFYQETGVQPYVYILPNGESTSVPDLKSRAEALYPQLFTDEAHFLLVFCDDGRGGYNCGYTVGSQAKTVMDNEAVSILADYLDRYYNDSSVSEEEIFSNAFAKTADRIMTVTRSPVVPVAVCIAAVIVIALLVFSLQKRREAKERQRQADEKMWSTPLESFGADEAAERAKKYENTDTHTQ